MEIKTLNKGQLRDFINSKEYKTMPFVPISYHRAISHINNPRAEDSDTLLVLLYENEEMLGYMGILPDILFTNSREEKIGWLSCLWVNPKHRGRQIAQKLLSTCYDSYDGKIMLTEFTEAAGRLYDKSGYFGQPFNKEGIRLYIRSNLAGILAPKKNLFKTIKPILKVSDFGANVFLDLKFLRRPKLNKEIFVEQLNEIDNIISDFIADKQADELFRRGKKELKHIISNPWILPFKDADDTLKRYHFSAFDKSFDFIPLKITDKNRNIIGFLLFAMRGKNLKMPYAYFDEQYIEQIIEVIFYYINKLHISSFTTYHKSISNLLTIKRTPAVFKKKVIRTYMLAKYFNDKLPKRDYTICDGDGDCSFT